MKRIKSNPQNWKIYKHHNQYMNLVSPGNYINDAIVSEDNFIFEASLKPLIDYPDKMHNEFAFGTINGHILYMSIKQMDNFLNAIMCGVVKKTKKGFKGTYTFYKNGPHYSIGVFNETE